MDISHDLHISLVRNVPKQNQWKQSCQNAHFKYLMIVDDCNICGSFYYQISFPGTSLMHNSHSYAQNYKIKSWCNHYLI